MRINCLLFAATAAMLALCVSRNANGFQASSEAKTTVVKQELSEANQQLIRSRIEQILRRDQQFRGYLSFNTTDDVEISRLEKLGMKEQLAAMAASKGQLSPEIEQLLRQLQLNSDVEILEEFVEIVETHGYPSPERIRAETDRLFVVLLHPPCKLEEIESHLEKMTKLLKPEVTAGRMAPRYYAMFVHNMLGKILRRPQLYGTNQQFDASTGKILPPQIADVDQSNQARREIGLPELEEGEFRVLETASKSGGSDIADASGNVK